MQTALLRRALQFVLVAALTATCVGSALLNAQAGPPRSLYLQLPADQPDPELRLAARPELDGRWTLVIEADRFRFTALCLVEAEAIPVGHAHVYEGDRKIASAFAPIADLGRLPPGRVEVRVVLRGQDHRALVGRRGLIESSLAIEVPGTL